MIRQEATFSASPARVYAVLTDGSQFSAATGGRGATIGAGEGGAFTLFGGAIAGRHVELVPGERIVQAWRAAPWPAGKYSLVRFTLAAHDGGTKLVLEHTGYPEEEHDHLAAGWPVNYFEPLRTYLAK